MRKIEKNQRVTLEVITVKETKRDSEPQKGGVGLDHFLWSITG